ncbi:MAG: hypothetical protein EOO67_01605, partial [Microbacterium sp.]
MDADRTARGRSRFALLVILIAAATLTACTTPTAPAGTFEPPAASPAPGTATGDPASGVVLTEVGNRHSELAQPGPFVVVYGDEGLNLWPSSYCYASGCADGIDDDPPDVGSPDELFVRVAEMDFDEVGAGLIGGGDLCAGRGMDAVTTDLGGGWWSVRPAGPADDYLVTLYAKGPAGSMAAELRWTTASDAPLPDPRSSLALVVERDGRPDVFGVDLRVDNLTASPSSYAAVITATAADGSSTTFTASSSHRCLGEGSLRFDGPGAVVPD